MEIILGFEKTIEFMLFLYNPNCEVNTLGN